MLADYFQTRPSLPKLMEYLETSTCLTLLTEKKKMSLVEEVGMKTGSRQRLLSEGLSGGTWKRLQAQPRHPPGVAIIWEV